MSVGHLSRSCLEHARSLFTAGGQVGGLTYDSTGPVQKAARVGGFKRYALPLAATRRKWVAGSIFQFCKR